MKKTLALLTLPVMVGVAHAQSSVTLYGIVDAGLVYINNQSGHSNIESVTGQTNGSRFGFRGTEDLGGGMKALFVLENGFDPSNGKLLQGGRLFGRQSYVGLQSPYGTLTLGRQYDPMTAYIGEIAATSIWAWLGTHPGDFDNLNSNFRVDNAVKYTSPDMAGLQISGIFAPGGVAGDFASRRIYTLGANYQHGPFTVAVAYDHLNNPATSAYDGTAEPGSPGFTSPGKSPVFSGYLSANTLEILGVGLAYKIGQAKIGLVYTNTRYHNILHTPSTPNSGSATFNSYEANARYYFTPAFLVGASFSYTQAETAKYEQVNFGPDYFLSKSTDILAVGVWQHASGIDSTGKPAVAAIGSLGQSTTPNQVAVKFSMRHRF
ncbi:porin [Paraburkholderia sp. RL18-103-BIB-C]|jgi:predicted porin|uniref:porin n=1 Tax=unclassified Paraburkholderia TaxID=2615204 RepID=UPI002F78A1A4